MGCNTHASGNHFLYISGIIALIMVVATLLVNVCHNNPCGDITRVWWLLGICIVTLLAGFLGDKYYEDGEVRIFCSLNESEAAKVNETIDQLISDIAPRDLF